MRQKETDLQLITNVDDEGIRDILDIKPMIISENLKALNFIGYEHGYGGHVSVGNHPESQV